MFAQEVDNDMAALKPEGSFTSGGRDLELAAYNVSFRRLSSRLTLEVLSGGSDTDSILAYQVTVTAGSMRRDSDLGRPSQLPRDIMGIHTTTVVTQRVDSL